MQLAVYYRQVQGMAGPYRFTIPQRSVLDQGQAGSGQVYADEAYAVPLRGETLEEVPDELAEGFNTILGKKGPRKENPIKEGQRKKETILMLQWVLLGQRPLKPEELLFATVAGAAPEAFPNDAILRRITSAFKGLIEIRKGDTTWVQFIHLSVNDFLFRNQRLWRVVGMCPSWQLPRPFSGLQSTSTRASIWCFIIYLVVAKIQLVRDVSRVAESLGLY